MKLISYTLASEKAMKDRTVDEYTISQSMQLSVDYVTSV